MARNKQIAIILADMLQFYGLDCLLKEYFSPLQISYFPNMQALAEKQPDWFDFYFTDAETFLIHGDASFGDGFSCGFCLFTYVYHNGISMLIKMCKFTHA